MDNKFDLKSLTEKTSLRDLILDSNRPTYKVHCFRCGKEFMSQLLFKNIACYVCTECSRKEYEEYPMSRKDLLDEDSVKVLEQFEYVCKKDLTDAEFRKEINDIIKSYTDLIPPEYFFGPVEAILGELK